MIATANLTIVLLINCKTVHKHYRTSFQHSKVLSNYTYELKDFKKTVQGEVALATLTINYKATMRNEQFDVTS